MGLKEGEMSCGFQGIKGVITEYWNTDSSSSNNKVVTTGAAFQELWLYIWQQAEVFPLRALRPPVVLWQITVAQTGTEALFLVVAHPAPPPLLGRQMSFSLKSTSKLYSGSALLPGLLVSRFRYMCQNLSVSSFQPGKCKEITKGACVLTLRIYTCVLLTP